eukprot:6783694-Heterocapsa_arctica.AAC.1
MEQTKSNTGTNQLGYIMFEDLRNNKYAGKLDENNKLAGISCPKLNIKGDIVEENLAMGFGWQNAESQLEQYHQIMLANGRTTEAENTNDKRSGR